MVVGVAGQSDRFRIQETLPYDQVPWIGTHSLKRDVHRIKGHQRFRVLEREDGTLKVDLYRSKIAGPTDGDLNDLMAKGTIKLEKVKTVELPRKPEWFGW